MRLFSTANQRCSRKQLLGQLWESFIFPIQLLSPAALFLCIYFKLDTVLSLCSLQLYYFSYPAFFGTYINTHTSIHISEDIYMQCIHIILVLVHTYIHTYIHTYTYMHTHTHTFIHTYKQTFLFLVFIPQLGFFKCGTYRLSISKY